MKKFLSSLLIGAFVFGLGTAEISIASAATPFSKSAYMQKKSELLKNHPAYTPKKPESPKNAPREQTRDNRHGGKTQNSR